MSSPLSELPAPRSRLAVLADEVQAIAAGCWPGHLGEKPSPYLIGRFLGLVRENPRILLTLMRNTATVWGLLSAPGLLLSAFLLRPASSWT